MSDAERFLETLRECERERDAARARVAELETVLRVCRKALAYRFEKNTPGEIAQRGAYSAIVRVMGLRRYAKGRNPRSFDR
jgi:hypothetical protein